MTATPREPHQPPYQGDHEPRITLREHVEALIDGLRRETEIELGARDKAVSKLEHATKEWQEGANEWRATVSDVTTNVRDEARKYTDDTDKSTREYCNGRFLTVEKGTSDLRAYVDQQIGQEREYVDGKFAALDEARSNGQRLILGAVGAATAIISVVVVIANSITG